ncbi:ubiquitin conjugation factor E4 [Cordyceps fumosorosea ARSEF 2679]|uniref:Ubiquitin conjugation factor E4 n=1 Tax=Cordyceps fumosorosea (strain ARSEF 2679) TaxID=1081104 RepID=A0A167LAY6_CORFA|nr:ubiquitin conjugation factor E4 [Cordyceps fumosorosea ARSEF 2679]OAA52863.1 ubiquitin conjugation factor E4 [Cordyceps fumosorosea ARSEF 2679]
MDPNDQPYGGNEAPDKEKLDQIRARRLAKLGAPKPQTDNEGGSGSSAGGQSASPKPTTANSSSGPAAPKTKINITPAAAAPARSGPNPFTQLGIGKQGDAKGSPGTATAPHASPRKRSLQEMGGGSLDGNAAAPPPRRPTTGGQAVETDEQYENRTLAAVFRLSVDPHHMSTPQGVRLTFLPGLNDELNQAGEPLRLSAATLDQAVIEACSAWPEDKPLLNYLLPCWKRAVKQAAQKTSSPARREVHDEAKRLCMSNCLFAVTMPELYGRVANPNHDTIAPQLLRGFTDENGICFDFIQEAIKRFDEDEAFPEIFNNAMVRISSQLSFMSMNDNYKPHVQALLTYTRFPILITNLSKHATFNMAQSAPGIEKHTLLGPFFRLSPLQAKAANSYFPGARSLDKGRITNAQDALRMVLRTHQDDLFTISNAFIRAGPETRTRTLDWFARIMNTNHKRRAIQADPQEIASDGFMLNIARIMDRFCEPFMDNDFSKVDKIDIKYLRRKPRVDIKDETKINADQATADKYYEAKEEGESNFISEAFFLTLAAHHYGSESLHSLLKNLEKDIKYFESRIQAMEAERSKVASNPSQLPLFESTLQKHVKVLENSIAYKHAIESVLLDDRMQSTSLRFMRYVAVWLLRIATGQNYKPGRESQVIKLPLSDQNQEAFACLPEYALQNIVDNFKFVFKWLPTILPSAVGEEMIALCVTFLRSSDWIKNPYLKSSLVSLLFYGTWSFLHLKKGVLGDQLVALPFANEYLLHALMKFYIECESTGNNAFYDKFNIRYEIFQVIKCVWSNDVYKQQLTRESKTNRGFFVQFVNMLLNDVTYVLDEALTKFPKIRTLEIELKGADISAEDRQKKQEELQTLGNQATSYMQLANETLEMMKLFTNALSDAFTMPEIVSRLASMLNYNLETLAGKRAAAELNVENREKYHFRPIHLLSDLVEIYLNLGASSVFVDAVAADGRSYKPEVLDRVTMILTSKHQKDPADMARWERLRERFRAAKAALDQAELDLGDDIPPEFEDPIMGDLMRDPVLLPSRHIVDRSTIVQHLLSDPKDPFTRQPMTVEDAVPQPLLKEKIERWREERVAEARKKLAGGGAAAAAGETGAAAGEAMDTTEG